MGRVRRLILVWALGLWLPAGAAAAAVTNVCPETPPTARAPSAGGSAAAPLMVTGTSHIVIMEYEAWFGPAATTGINPQPQVTTCLESADMAATGGGYDSADPAVIARHAAWLEQMGMDAVTLDLTNNVSCIYDGDDPAIIAKACPDAAFRAQNRAIRANDIGLYAAWSRLGTPLKIVPLLGGFDPWAVTPDPSDAHRRTALEKEIEDFGTRMAAYPALSVIYGGRPLMLLYLGTPVDPGRVHAIRSMLRADGLETRFNIKLIGGYLDSQPAFWADPQATPTGPIEIAPAWGFWSVVDRINFWGAPPAPYYPTYNRIGGRIGGRIENLTVSLATAGQAGWGCGKNGGLPYCPDAALRYCGEGFENGCQPGLYETLREFMGYARQLEPTFLIVDQLNEFAQPDEGWNAETNDDAEPTRQWGYSAMRALITEIAGYRRAVAAGN